MNYLYTWFSNTSMKLEYADLRVMDNLRWAYQNFGDPSLIMPMYKPSPFRASVKRTNNAIFISGVDFSKSKVSFYNPNTGELMKYMNFASSPFYTDVPEDWVVCVKGDDMIPFVDFGENAQIDVTPTY